MASIKIACFSCGEVLSFEGVLGRGAECSRCMADVRVCKNCEHYDERAYNECHETIADRVKNKDRSNFCEYFRPRQAARLGDGAGRALSAQELAKQRLEALFGGGGASSAEDED